MGIEPRALYVLVKPYILVIFLVVIVIFFKRAGHLYFGTSHSFVLTLKAKGDLELLVGVDFVFVVSLALAVL